MVTYYHSSASHIHYSHPAEILQESPGNHTETLFFIPFHGTMFDPSKCPWAHSACVPFFSAHQSSAMDSETRSQAGNVDLP